MIIQIVSYRVRSQIYSTRSQQIKIAAKLARFFCRCEESSSNPKFLPVLTKGSGPGSDTATLEITETNLYRRLVHLSLELCRGTDARIREHLAERLVRVQRDFDDLSDKFRNVQSEASSVRSGAVDLKNEVEKLRREKTELVILFNLLQ